MKLEMAANQVLKQFSRQIRKEDASKGLSMGLRQVGLHGRGAVRVKGMYGL